MEHGAWRAALRGFAPLNMEHGAKHVSFLCFREVDLIVDSKKKLFSQLSAKLAMR